MDPQQANLQSIDVLERTRAAFIRCREELGLAIAEADSEVDRLVTWLQNDRVMYWRGRVNRLREDVNNARSALFRKETVTSSKDSKPSTVDERKALARAKALLEDAERRAARTRTWAQLFPREQALYKGGMAVVSSMHERDLPAAIMALTRMVAAMEAYVRDEPPDLSTMLEREIAASERAASMKRAVDPEPGVDSEARPAAPDAGATP
jgi:hypothetical protein